METINRFFTWWKETFQKQGIVGKVVLGCSSLFIICCLLSVPIGILSQKPSTTTTPSDSASAQPITNNCGGGILVILILAALISPPFLRKRKIMSHVGEWGEETCQLIIKKKVAVGMTEEMVKLSWGNPKLIDDREVTANSKKERWVYGQPRKEVRYVSFTDGKVVKIKT